MASVLVPRRPSPVLIRYQHLLCISPSSLRGLQKRLSQDLALLARTPREKAVTPVAEASRHAWSAY
jgi:hypothetical protein